MVWISTEDLERLQEWESESQPEKSPDQNQERKRNPGRDENTGQQQYKYVEDYTKNY